MTPTGETTTPDPLARATRLAARQLIADLAVQQRLVGELQTLADEKLRDLYSGETKLRVFLERLGLPADEAWKAGALDVDAAMALLSKETTP